MMSIKRQNIVPGQYLHSLLFGAVTLVSYWLMQRLTFEPRH
jgi:hypothetical protein